MNYISLTEAQRLLGLDWPTLCTVLQAEGVPLHQIGSSQLARVQRSKVEALVQPWSWADYFAEVELPDWGSESETEVGS